MKSKNPKSVPYKPRGAERIYYISHYIYKKKFLLPAIILKRINQFFFHVNIPSQVEIGLRLILPHGGFGVIMNRNTKIGDDAIIFQNVTIGNQGALIGDRVVIGAGAVILGGIKIGNDVYIGANTFVNFDVPNNSTVVSPKGRIICRDTINKDDKNSKNETHNGHNSR